MQSFEKMLESILWNSRLVVILPTVMSLVLALGLFITTTYDAVLLMGEMVEYFGANNASDAQVEILAQTVAVVDGYLLALIMLIFALGIYELFVNKLQAAETSEIASRVLLIQSFDDLKDRLANVVILILVVKFFQQALRIKYKSPEDLLAFALGLIFVSGALYLTGRLKTMKKGAEQ